jgi:hypothetical protein
MEITVYFPISAMYYGMRVKVHALRDGFSVSVISKNELYHQLTAATKTGGLEWSNDRGNT